MLNIVLHAVISALMIDVFAILIGGLAYDENDRILNHAPKTSLLAALFFAAHPVHTESVSTFSNPSCSTQQTEAISASFECVYKFE